MYRVSRMNINFVTKSARCLQNKYAHVKPMPLPAPIINNSNIRVQKLDQMKKKKSNLKASLEESDVKGRLLGFRKLLEQEKGLNTFDRHVFESIIDEGIIGGVDKTGNDTPFKITFIYITGISNSLDGNHFKTPRRNAKDKKETADELYSNTINEVNELYPDNNHDTRGSG